MVSISLGRVQGHQVAGATLHAVVEVEDERKSGEPIAYSVQPQITRVGGTGPMPATVALIDPKSGGAVNSVTLAPGKQARLQVVVALGSGVTIDDKLIVAVHAYTETEFDTASRALRVRA